MNLVICGLIRVYWLLWPRHLNRGCLFRETCSRHVYRIASEFGSIAACSAFYRRYCICRPGYAASTSPSGELGLVHCDGSFSPQELIAEDVLASIKRTTAELELHFSESELIIKQTEIGNRVKRRNSVSGIMRIVDRVQ